MNALLNHRWGVSPAQDSVWAQVTGLAPRRAAKRLLMPLNFQAFIDDSTGPARELILAGHIATAEVWAKFAKDWEDLLPLGTVAKNGKHHFHMTEMAMRAETMARVPKFYEVIDRYNLFSVSCRVNLDDYEEAMRQVESAIASSFRMPVNFALFNNPYRFAFQAFLDGFHKSRTEREMQIIIPLDETVDFIFDDRTEKNPILRGWQDCLDTRDEDIRDFFGATPRFENDQQFLPLQAADLWAWWVREWYEEDASHLPDKMKNHDFGIWRGKSRPGLAYSFTVEDMVKNLFATLTLTVLEG